MVATSRDCAVVLFLILATNVPSQVLSAPADCNEDIYANATEVEGRLVAYGTSTEYSGVGTAASRFYNR
jgi:hypothetical protein